jgi:hypothetical protein
MMVQNFAQDSDQDGDQDGDADELGAKNRKNR